MRATANRKDTDQFSLILDSAQMGFLYVIILLTLIYKCVCRSRCQDEWSTAER